MQTYDFETVIRRENVGSSKWDEIKETLGFYPENIIPFSVADMEFSTAPEITEGLKTFLDNSVLGYALATDRYKETVCSWFLKRHNWEIKKEWIRETCGVINAFFTAVKAFTKEGDGVMLMTPVYYPMYMAVSRHNRTLVENKLIRTGNTYAIDFDDFEAKAKDANTKLLILCNPHNPSTRVFTRRELERIARICLENHVLVVSDEIHCDLTAPGYRHIPYALISPEAAQNCLVCTAPSKSFNLAGLQTSNVIIPNEGLRETFINELRKDDGNPKCNILGYEACRIAYERCGEWLDGAKAVIETNHRLVCNFMEKELPMLKPMKMEGTYLLWMDFRGLGMDSGKLSRFVRKEALLFFDDGYIFGKAGDGFERWNLACPTKYVKEGLIRLKEAVDRYKKG